MEHDIVEGKLGSVGAYDVEIKGLKLIAVSDLATAAGEGILTLSAKATVEIDMEKVILQLTKVIPGTVDDALAMILINALKAESKK